MRTQVKVTAGTLAATAGLLAIPAGASAAPVLAAPLAPCYTSVPPNGVPSIPVSLTGGTPGDLYQIVATYPGKGEGSAASVASQVGFDATGAGAGTLTDVYPDGDPIVPVVGRPVNLTVVDFNVGYPDGQSESVLGTTLLTTTALNVSDKPTNPRKKRAVTVSGTQFANQKLYGFVVNKAGTKILRRFYIGQSNVCGYARTTAVVAPTKFAYGTYKLFVNAGPKLNKKASLSSAFSITREF
jgi:hypothetical protein